MIAKEVTISVKTKITFKFDYFPRFLLCLKNAKFKDHLKTEKRKKWLRVRTKPSVDAKMLKTLASHLRS